ncbi:MAG: hypothetical protein WCM76_02980 [Bacteroidota bacterium]
MNSEKEHLDTLNEIKNLMQHSTRFLSLSGLTGIFAGIFALLGAAAAYLYLDLGLLSDNYYSSAYSGSSYNGSFLVFFLADALSVLFLALGCGIYFTMRNARRKDEQVWGRATKMMLLNLFIPLIAGGLFCVVLVFYNVIFLVAPATLIFYGLALINAGKYTLRDIRYLGGFEIGLGLIACTIPGYGLLFWAAGFGVMHIIYGTLMFYKYEKC